MPAARILSSSVKWPWRGFPGLKDCEDCGRAARGSSGTCAIGAAQYAGTDYDQGGYIYVAGMVISNNPLSFAIAEHTKDFNRVRDVVRYEGEHLVLYHNDRQRYMQTRDHSKGGAHPILQ